MKTRATAAAAALLMAPALATAVPSAGWASDFSCHGHPATIVGTPGADDLSGTSGPDVIVGRAGIDTIHGGGGDDIICGGRAKDLLYGGEGNDAVYAAHGRDFLFGGDGDDTLAGGAGRTSDFSPGAGDDVMRDPRGRPSLDYGDAPNPVTVDLSAGTATGWGNDKIVMSPTTGGDVVGSAHDDTIIGTESTDSLFGGFGGGFDTIDGRGGGDFLGARAGVLHGGDGADSVSLGYGPEALAGADSVLDGGAGNDGLIGPLSTGHVDAGPGDDQVQLDASIAAPGGTLDIAGGTGKDLLWLFPDFGTKGSALTFDMATGDLSVAGDVGLGSEFEDFWMVGSPASVDVWGTDGPNHISVASYSGDAAPTVVHGRGGADSIASDAADDTLYGDDGDDTLEGSVGDDLIDGGPGNDTGNGGPGTDSCTAVEAPTSCEVVAP